MTTSTTAGSSRRSWPPRTARWARPAWPRWAPATSSSTPASASSGPHPAGLDDRRRVQQLGRHRLQHRQAALTGLDQVRDALALRIKGELEAAAFGHQPIIGAAAPDGRLPGDHRRRGAAGQHLSSAASGRAAVRRKSGRRPGRAAGVAQWSGESHSRRPRRARSSSSGRPARSAPRRSTSSGATPAASGSWRWPRAAASPDVLARQAAEFGVAAVAVARPAAAAEVQAALRDHLSRTSSAPASANRRQLPCAPGARRPGRGQRGGRRGRATWCSTA